MFHKTEDVQALFNILNIHKINYVLTKNIADELPSKLKLGKDIDLLVHPSYYAKIQYLMYIYNYEQIVHPHGKENGWQFIYGAHENIMFRHVANALMVDVYAELCTKSLSMNAWLPLDKIIQESVWRDKVWDAANQWWIMDDENILIYLLTRSVFEKPDFSAAYIQEIEKRKELLTTPTAREKLEKTFFKFTDTLIQKVSHGQYQEIFNSYLTFTDY